MRFTYRSQWLRSGNALSEVECSQDRIMNTVHKKNAFECQEQLQLKSFIIHF